MKMEAGLRKNCAALIKDWIICDAIGMASR